jgi:DNA replication protein DnaC
MKAEIETIKCHCGESFQWENDPDPQWRDRFRPTLCSTCEEHQEAEHQAERLKAEIEAAGREAREKAHRTIPPLFHGTDTAHPRFNAKAWDRVKDHALTWEKPWLGLIGETGLSKTRIAALFAIGEIQRMAEAWTKNRSHYRKPRFVFTTGYRISELASLVQNGSFDQKEEARAELESITTCDLLLIDDLGKGRGNDSIAASLFALVDHRYAHILQTIWTSNSTPEEISAPMSRDMSSPFAGRLNDHSRIIKLK